MGNVPSLFTARPQPEHKILIHGIDAAGKTALLYSLKLGKMVDTASIGFNFETLHSKEGREFTVWDVQCRDKSRYLVKHFYPQTEGIIFIVDISDHERMEYARETFLDE
jgi:small GTP-binding protein